MVNYDNSSRKQPKQVDSLYYFLSDNDYRLRMEQLTGQINAIESRLKMLTGSKAAAGDQWGAGRSEMGQLKEQLNKLKVERREAKSVRGRPLTEEELARGMRGLGTMGREVRKQRLVVSKWDDQTLLHQQKQLEPQVAEVKELISQAEAELPHLKGKRGLDYEHALAYDRSPLAGQLRRLKTRFYEIAPPLKAIEMELHARSEIKSTKSPSRVATPKISLREKGELRAKANRERYESALQEVKGVGTDVLLTVQEELQGTVSNLNMRIDLARKELNTYRNLRGMGNQADLAHDMRIASEELAGLVTRVDEAGPRLKAVEAELAARGAGQK